MSKHLAFMLAKKEMAMPTEQSRTKNKKLVPSSSFRQLLVFFIQKEWLGIFLV